MSAVPKAFLLRRRVHNPALGVPRRTAPVSGAVRAALIGARQPVCAQCEFYLQRDGQHRCTHVERECELMNLGLATESCPIDAWKETA